MLGRASLFIRARRPGGGGGPPAAAARSSRAAQGSAPAAPPWWWSSLASRSSSSRTASSKLLALCVTLAAASSLLLFARSQASADSTPFAQRVAHLQASYKGPAASAYGVAAGYWRLDVNYSAPVVPLLGRPRYHAALNRSCWELAAAHPETYSAAYQPTQQPPTDLPGGVPRAAWQWRGRITRLLFDSVPFLLRDKALPTGTTAEPCQHCTFVLRYKVLGGQLYTDVTRRHRSLMGGEKEAAEAEELLLAALYMFKVPDVDFLLHLGDGCPPGLPLVQANINRSNEAAGFTLPMSMWWQALGPVQFAVLAECLQARYPPRPQQQRRQRAVWRGSNTDSRVLLMDESNVLDVMRTRLHLYGRWHPGLFDAHYTSFPQQAFATASCIGDIMPPGPELPLEEFNRYALLLDIDGNGWSDRYRLFAHFNTPVLKQASNLTAFFEHLAAPGGAMVEHYAHDLSDLPQRAAALLAELRDSPERLLRMAERQQGLAAYLLNQASLMHAAAYTLATVSRLSAWKPVQEPSYELVPFSRCCGHTPNLPRAFVEAVRAWGATLGQPSEGKAGA